VRPHRGHLREVFLASITTTGTSARASSASSRRRGDPGFDRRFLENYLQ
jgi:hypothetical protein